MIVQATLQSLLNVAVFGMTEQQAVEAPRAISMAFPNSFHPHRHPEAMVAIENRVPGTTLEGLRLSDMTSGSGPRSNSRRDQWA